jgi:hypothetical protein
MAGSSVQVIVVSNRIPQVTPKMQAGAAAALNAGGMAMIGYADPLTPVGPTGLLKGNKTIRTASPGSLTFSCTWNQFYGIYQEMGTSRGVPARHFARDGSARAQPNLIAGLKAVGGQLA